MTPKRFVEELNKTPVRNKTEIRRLWNWLQQEYGVIIRMTTIAVILNTLPYSADGIEELIIATAIKARDIQIFNEKKLFSKKVKICFYTISGTWETRIFDKRLLKQIWN